MFGRFSCCTAALCILLARGTMLGADGKSSSVVEKLHRRSKRRTRSARSMRFSESIRSPGNSNLRAQALRRLRGRRPSLDTPSQSRPKVPPTPPTPRLRPEIHHCVKSYPRLLTPENCRPGTPQLAIRRSTICRAAIVKAIDEHDDHALTAALTKVTHGIGYDELALPGRKYVEAATLALFVYPLGIALGAIYSAGRGDAGTSGRNATAGTTRGNFADAWPLQSPRPRRSGSSGGPANTISGGASRRNCSPPQRG